MELQSEEEEGHKVVFQAEVIQDPDEISWLSLCFHSSKYFSVNSDLKKRKCLMETAKIGSDFSKCTEAFVHSLIICLC